MGGELEELFIFSDLSCVASEHAWFGQPEATGDSEAGSSPCTAQPACSVGPRTRQQSPRVPGYGSDPMGLTGMGQPQAQPCHAWATTTTHVTLLGVGAGVQMQSKKCKRRRGAAPTKRLLHPNAFLLPRG